MFAFIAANGELIATSPPHITRSAAERALRETIAAAGKGNCYHKLNHGFQYYFELRNESGMQLLISEKFESPGSRDYAITITQVEAPKAICRNAIV